MSPTFAPMNAPFARGARRRWPPSVRIAVANWSVVPGGERQAFLDRKGRLTSISMPHRTGQQRSRKRLRRHRRCRPFADRKRRTSLAREPLLNLGQLKLLLLRHRFPFLQQSNTRAFAHRIGFSSVAGHYNSSKNISISFPSRTYSRTLNCVPRWNRTSSSSGYADQLSISLPCFEAI